MAGNIIVKILKTLANNKSHQVITSGTTIVNNDLVMFSPTTRDRLIPGADTVGARFFGVSTGVFEADEYADIDIPLLLELTEETSGTLNPGDVAYVFDAQNCEATGNVPIGRVLAIDLNGVSGNVLILTNAGAAALGGSAGVQALVGTVAFTDTSVKTLGILPAYATPIDFYRTVTTAFNADGTDLLDVGTTIGDPDEYIDGDDVSSTGMTRAGSGATMATPALGVQLTADATVYGLYSTSDATNLTTGAVLVVLLYTVA